MNKAKIDVTKDLTRFKSDQTKAGWVSCQLLYKLRTNHLGSFVMALSVETLFKSNIARFVNAAQYHSSVVAKLLDIAHGLCLLT